LEVCYWLVVELATSLVERKFSQLVYLDSLGHLHLVELPKAKESYLPHVLYKAYLVHC